MSKYHNWDSDMMDDIEEQLFNDRQSRRIRKRKPNHEPKMSESEIIDQLADEAGLAGGFETTYQPSKHEAEWLLQSLQSFYYQDLISDVMAVVKGGKEASVYRCRAHESTDYEWVAAKVYRPRKFRNLRNDKVYREGRAALGANGKEINDKDWRTLKALARGSGFGQTLSHTSWLMYEYKTLTQLHQAGAAVPQPIAVSENALLMTYHGDADTPAPTLNEVQLQPYEVKPLFDEVMRNINLMLQHGIAHGDLSAYNILYWAGELIVIDFPQVVDLQGNRHARSILARDIQRVCEYFISLGLNVDPEQIASDFWNAYGHPDADPEVVLFNILATASHQEDIGE